MCNLYSLNKGQDHIRREFQVNWDDTGNMPPLAGIFPDMMAPVVRNDGDVRRMQMMRWGMPTPPKFLTAGAIDRGVTNIRNGRLAEGRDRQQAPMLRLGPGPPVRRVDATRQILRAARKTGYGLRSTRIARCLPSPGSGAPGSASAAQRGRPVEGKHQLYGFLTAEANATVRPVHSKAMPVILTGEPKRRPKPRRSTPPTLSFRAWCNHLCDLAARAPRCPTQSSALYDCCCCGGT
jgi:hypothetical protein